jgi:hypothetical protein
MQIVDPNHLVPPGQEVAVNSAVVGNVAVHIDRAIVGRDAFEAGRVHYTHEPLRPTIIGLTVATDASIAPRLARAPFDDLVEILLLVLAQEVVLALRQAGASDIDVDHGVTLGLDIPVHRTDFPPQE